MNILILHSSSDLYGASKILLTTVRLLKDSFRLTVVLSEEGPLAIELRKEGIEVIIIRLGILRRKYFNLSGLFNRAFVLRKAKRQLSEVVKEKQIDLIYSNTTAVLIGAIVARNCNIKHVWHIHEIIKKPSWFTKFIGYFLNNFSDKVIVVSNAVKDHWLPLLNDKSKLVTIYNGIDYEPYLKSTSSLRAELSIGQNELIIGMIGRVHFWKGQKYFLEIASLISREYPNVKFIMVGDVFPGYEHLYQELNELKLNLSLDEIVYNLGFRTDIPNVLKSFDLFISPSILPDPLPTVILEAMASGIPVIATNHGGSVEMVENLETGVLVPWDDSKTTFELCKDLIENQQQRLLMGAKGRERVLKYFSQESFKRNMKETLEQLNKDYQ